MNLFRSEEHVGKWSGFKPETDGGIVSLANMVRLFSGNFFTKRLEPDYVSHMREYMMEMVVTFKEMGSFWQIPFGDN
ncbi:MAG: hypothetical protein GY849_14575 [Deltaproteobacteria bacterium]|nr:hypothetical protein [Deltaproteobacteria bacterium]